MVEKNRHRQANAAENGVVRPVHLASMVIDDSPFTAQAPGQVRFDLSAELVALDAVSPSSYEISSDETDLGALDPQEQNQHLNSLIDQLALISPDQLPRERQVWDDLRTFLKHFEQLQDSARSKVADGINSSFAHLVTMIMRDTQGAQRQIARRRGDENDSDHDSDDDYGSASPEQLRQTYCQAIEMWAFLVNWLLYIADKVANSGASSTAIGSSSTTTKSKGRGRKGASTKTAGSAATSTANIFPWTDTILPTMLGTVSKFLETFPSAILYPLSTPRDALLSTLLRPTLHILERESNVKAAAEIKTQVFAVACSAVKRHGQSQTALTMLLQMLQYYEHLPEVLAQLLTTLRVEYDYPRLGEELLTEISNREFGSGGNAGAGSLAMTVSQENKTPRVFARFLVAFAETNPRSTLKTISLLRNLIDSEAYPIRNALVEVIALLIKELVMTEEQVSSSYSESEESQREQSAEAKQKQIEAFWELLFERFLDVNSYVRVKVLNVCAKLCDLPAKFPVQRTRLLTLAQRGLKDKSSSARKVCVALLTRMILTHPYGLMHGGELEEKVWQARVDEVSKKMAELSGGLELPTNNDSVIDADESRENADESTNERAPASKSSAGQHQSFTAEELSSKLSPQDLEALHRLNLTQRYYTDALTFIQSLSVSMPILEELLYSQSKAEALEAMDFFRVAAEYKLPGAEKGMRKMIHLVWTKDNTMVEPTAGGVTGAASNLEDREAIATTTTRSIKGRLIEVYVSLYFSPLSHLGEKENVGLIARNLVQRTRGASLAELTSLEELLSTMCSDNLISAQVVEKLWSVYATPAKRQIEKSHRRGAIIVLSMLAAAKRQIVQDKIDILLGVGLGPLGAVDPILAKWTVVALGRVGGSTKKVKGALSDRRTRFPMSHPMFAKLRSAIVQQGNGEQAKGEWFGLAENCVQVIYELGEQPDRLCGEIIRWFTAQIFSSDSVSSPSSPSSPSESQHLGLATSASAFQLAQLIFIVGHVSLKQVVYLENVEREYKRRKAEAERISNANKDAGTSAKKTTATAQGRGKKGSQEAGKEGEAQEADELEQVAGNVEDEIGEVIADVRETELLYGGCSLLALYGPMVVHIASNPKTYASDHLRKAAVLTLCKFMCVSSAFCEANLSLLLHILATSSDPTTRSNVVIALGDIAVSFGTLVDENSDRLYAGLNDKDLGVKKHTLMVLTHLILNGMIKVKGQLGEMAKCLEDPETRVSDLAKLFFSELATKENAVYNNLPDIISHLSIGKHAVDEETFERTMKFIFTFVDKEKQAENVVEKLCQRFRLTSAVRQWRDIAYCLSLLPYKSERSVKKLIEGLPFYQDKLYDEVVHRRFVEIIAKARSAGGAKAAGAGVGGGSEAELQDYEQLIESSHSKGEEDANAIAKVAKARQRSRRNPASQMSQDVDAQPEELDEGAADDDHEPVAPPPTKRSTATKTKAAARAAKQAPPPRASRRRRVVESSDEDEDEQEEDDSN